MSPSTSNSLTPLPLPDGVTADYVDCTSSCGLIFHVLKSGEAGKPLVLFTHGFPELAFSWRKILPSVAAKGYYCVAMDQRGYGRTTGWDARPYAEVRLEDYTFTNLVRDLVCLVYKLGYTEVYGIVGHDFGAVSSAMAALMRPDMFKSSIQMSHPHHAPPKPSFDGKAEGKKLDIQAALAKLSPPRKHYKWDNSGPEAAEEWVSPAQGLQSYLRGYFHLKSAAWDKNKPHPLGKWSAEVLEGMPEYYVMQKDRSMPETVAANMEGEDDSKTESWLPDEDLQVYVQEWSRTGFQGGLNWYRAQTLSTPQAAADMLLFAGRRIEVPCAFITGKQDWGSFQQPKALESYEDLQVVKEGMYKGLTFIDNAGHWVQQEQAEATAEEVIKFLASI